MKHMKTKQDLFKLLDELAYVRITTADDDGLISLSGQLQRVVSSLAFCVGLRNFAILCISGLPLTNGKLPTN